MLKEEKIEINTLRTSKSDTFKTINVSGIFGGHRPGIFEVFVFSDEMEPERALETIPPNPEKMEYGRAIECRLVIDPFQAKSIALWLQQHVEEYEKQFGEIKVNEETKKPSIEEAYRIG